MTPITTFCHHISVDKASNHIQALKTTNDFLTIKNYKKKIQKMQNILD